MGRPVILGRWGPTLLGLLLAGCSAGGRGDSPEEVAAATVDALARRDMTALSRVVHPERGVRFTPYGYVRPDSDVVLTPAEIRAGGGGRELLWGEYDGTGEPIRLRFADYVERFVYDADFAGASEVSWETRIGVGNSIDNCREIYAGARVVEHHVPGVEPELDGLDWRSLRLVIVAEGEAWYLVGIIHDEWTT